MSRNTNGPDIVAQTFVSAAPRFVSALFGLHGGTSAGVFEPQFAVGQNRPEESGPRRTQVSAPPADDLRSSETRLAMPGIARTCYFQEFCKTLGVKHEYAPVFEFRRR
jgi:hypothetical protein